MKNFKFQTSNLKINPKFQIPAFWILKLFVGICFGFGILMFGFSANAAQVSSSDLLNNPDRYNGKVVTYDGEVIGDIMEGWINIKDKNATIGVFVNSKKMLDKIAYRGDYKIIGDKVRITGVFNKACPVHGGDFDIDAQNLVVLKLGHKIYRPLNRKKIYLFLILFGVTVLVYLTRTIILYRKKVK